MRKGLKTTLILNQDTLAYKIYASLKIEERHRHRYEVNPIHTDFIQQLGLRFSGIAEEDTRRNIVYTFNYNLFSCIVILLGIFVLGYIFIKFYKLIIFLKKINKIIII